MRSTLIVLINYINKDDLTVGSLGDNLKTRKGKGVIFRLVYLHPTQPLNPTNSHVPLVGVPMDVLLRFHLVL